MPLDPQARAFLDTIPGDGEPDYDALSPELIRTGYEALVASEDPVSVQEEFDREIPRSAGGIPVRVYRPHSGELPALVYFHGGGFVTGSITSHHSTHFRRNELGQDSKPLLSIGQVKPLAKCIVNVWVRPGGITVAVVAVQLVQQGGCRAG